jgi:hypothetical protein
MFFDGVIAVLLGACAWRMAYLGVYVTIHPPESRKGRTKKSLKREFYLIGGLSTILILAQVFRADRTYSALMSEIRKGRNASVSIFTVTPPGPSHLEDLVDGAPVLFNVKFLVTENTARNMRDAVEAYLVDKPPLPEVSRAVIGEFKSKEAKKLNYQGQDMPAGTGKWETVSYPLNETQIKSVLDGTSTLYVVGTAHWVNPSGSDGHFDGCTYLQKPEGRRLTFDNSMWHSCGV